MTGTSIKSLKEGIKKCDANIVIFEEAIRKERQAQEDFRFMMDTARSNEEKRNLVAKGVTIEVE